ncbi:hypothetical protein IEE94_03610 [Yimella sp. cx-573]|nr:hypothetical protein [Yimella sp. cx-573]
MDFAGVESFNAKVTRVLSRLAFLGAGGLVVAAVVQWFRGVPDWICTLQLAGVVIAVALFLLFAASVHGATAEAMRERAEDVSVKRQGP